MFDLLLGFGVALVVYLCCGLSCDLFIVFVVVVLVCCAFICIVLLGVCCFVCGFWLDW